MAVNINGLVTESRNQNTMNIDEASTLEMVKLINNEDKTVAYAVEKELKNIAKAVDAIYAAMKKGGRLFYSGAGTSGRLGVLDASECPPTYGVSNEIVVPIIAGGDTAITTAVEDAEDSETLLTIELKARGFTCDDVLVGIAASGRTPFVIGGMKYAKDIGATVISLTCNPDSEMAAMADIAISPVVGPEAVTGSTRMKAGTAQKFVLNMLSTATMIKLGKVYQNLMVDMMPTNLKLIEREKRIIMQATGCDYETAEEYAEASGYHAKTAIVMLLLNVSADEAKQKLEQANGHIGEAVKK